MKNFKIFSEVQTASGLREIFNLPREGFLIQEVVVVGWVGGLAPLSSTALSSHIGL